MATLILRLLLSLLFLLPAAGEPARAADAAAAADADWSGAWDTRWRGGGARMVLEQQGRRVTGRYALYDGVIEGQAEGDRLTGTWRESSGRQGQLEFYMGDDGESFVGRFRTGEWWTGGRVEAGGDDPDLAFDRSTPQDALRTFLIAGAYARDGDFDMFASALNTLTFEDDPDSTLAQHQIDRMLLLCDVLDQFTLRLRDVPEQVAGDVYETTIRQAGRDETFPLRFQRTPDGTWRLAVPPTRTLKDALQRLLWRSGGRPPPPNDYVALATPRQAFEALIRGAAEDGFDSDTVESALDLSFLSPLVHDDLAPVLASYLKLVIDHVAYVIYQEIPNDPDSRTPFVFFEHPAGSIVVTPNQTEDGVKWQFSVDTLKDIRDLYVAVESLPPPVDFPLVTPVPLLFKVRDAVRDLSPELLDLVGPMELWQWLAIVLLIAAGVAAGALVNLVASRRLPPGPMARWGAMAVAVGVAVVVGRPFLGLPGSAARIVEATSDLAILAGAVPLLLALVDWGGRTARQAYRVPGHNDILVSLSIGLAKVAVVFGALILAADVLDLPYGSVLAGLGIGGLAVALAARSTLENVIGGFTLFADKSIRVGDFCRAGKHVGVVESIGLRSTLLRAPDRTLITVPNADFAAQHLENYSRRDRVLMTIRLGLRYETTPDQLRYVLSELRTLLASHARIASDGTRVRFVGFGDHSLDIELRGFAETTDWSEYLAIQEDILLHVMSRVEDAGTGLAFPSQVMYSAEDRGLNAERAKAAEETVRQWREQERLPFPDLAADERGRLRATVPWPPAGAPAPVVAEEGGAEASTATRRGWRLW